MTNTYLTTDAMILYLGSVFLIKVIQFTINYFSNIIEFSTIPAVQQLEEIILKKWGLGAKRNLFFVW